MKKPAKPVPFCTIDIEKMSAGARVPGHRFAHDAGNCFVFDCPDSVSAVMKTLADQYDRHQVTLRVTVEAFIRKPNP